MINELERALIETLRAARVDGYPATVEAYTGQLLRLADFVPNVPAALVHVSGGQFERWDVSGRAFAGRHTIEILTVDANLSGVEGQHEDAHRIIDWVLDNLPGKVLSDGATQLAYAGPVSYEVMITDKAGDVLLQVGRIVFDATIHGRN